MNNDYPIKQNKSSLIVFVPEGLTQLNDFARRIHQIAAQEQRDILLFGLIDDWEQNLGRLLTTLEALTRDNFIQVHSTTACTQNWEASLCKVVKPGDRVLCHDGQYVKTGRLKTQLLTDYLQTKYGLRVMEISGFYNPQKEQITILTRSLLFWIVCLGMIAGFFILEINIDSILQGPSHSVVLLMLLLIEIGTVWTWKRIFR